MIANDRPISGVTRGNSMRKVITFAAAAGIALALSACDPKAQEAPAPAAEAEVDPAAVAGKGVEETSNPIRPAEAADSGEAAPAAE